MVTGTHPEDIDLFGYVEGELPGPRRAEIETHLASCSRCAEQIALVQAGRDVLRGSGMLELPADRRAAILRSLPAQPGTTRRRLGFSPRKLVTVVAPIAAVAAVVAAIVTTGDFSGGGSDGGGAMTGAARGAEAGKTTEQATGAMALDRLRKVAGPLDEVAAELRSKGIDARVVGNHVEVRNATRAQVDRALRDRRTGKVRIVIVP